MTIPPLPDAPPRAPTLAVELMFEAAARLGWRTRLIDPTFGYLWEVELPDGRRRTMVGAKTPINDASAAQVASDKDYCARVLHEEGYPVPHSVRALSPKFFQGTEYADRSGPKRALDLAAREGFPLIVKPNRMSHGRLVRVVRCESDLIAALEQVWELDRIALVQEFVEGRELRLDLLDGQPVACYERRALELVGDGQSTEAELLAALDRRFRDPRALLRAEADGLKPGNILEAGATRRLESGVHNLNRSATATLLPTPPERWRAWGARIAERLGLRLAGIDLRIEGDGDPYDLDPAAAVVLEVNGTPLLTQLARMGHRELAIDTQARILVAAFG
ncbi:MAG: hypothetical protein AAFZ65_10095 [Planctomycetota bacterium]